jgi:hypothetical protein
VSKASFSEVAANTTTVPETFPAAEALLAAAGVLLGAAAVLLDDELQAATSSATKAHTSVISVIRRLRGALERR